MLTRPNPKTVNQENKLQIIKYKKKKSDWEPIAATCQFLYKGYQITIATDGHNPYHSQGPVAIYGGFNYDIFLRDGFKTVEECINWINLHSANGAKRIFVKKEGFILNIYGGNGPIYIPMTELDKNGKIQDYIWNESSVY